MRKNIRLLMAVAATLAMASGPWVVQAQQSIPGVQGSPSAPAGPSVEGRIKKVNPAARTVDVSVGIPGLWVKTLEVTDGTQIQAEGQRATLEDISEGVKVKASYENRAGKSFATRIELVPASQPTGVPGQARPKTQ